MKVFQTRYQRIVSVVQNGAKTDEVDIPDRREENLLFDWRSSSISGGASVACGDRDRITFDNDICHNHISWFNLWTFTTK